MNRSSMLLAAVLLSAWATGCASYVPFSHEVRSQHDLSEQDLQRLQFYLSHDITLRREVRTQGREIQDGKLELVSGKHIEEVVIDAQTPGVAVAIEPAAITISFEEGTALTFSLLDDAEPLPLQIVGGSDDFAQPPDAFPGDRRDTNAERLRELIGNYFLSGGQSAVSFRGKQWDAVGESHKAHLMINAESLEEVVERQTTLSGRRL